MPPDSLGRRNSAAAYSPATIEPPKRRNSVAESHSRFSSFSSIAPAANGYIFTHTSSGRDSPIGDARVNGVFRTPSVASATIDSPIDPSPHFLVSRSPRRRNKFSRLSALRTGPGPVIRGWLPDTTATATAC